MSEHAGEIKAKIIGIIKDESITGHDLEQLRIFFNQAADLETLQAIGLSEVQPYIDRIDAVASIDEMNALLVAEDFPFCPFLTAVLAGYDTRATNIAQISPNLVLFDAAVVGGMYYQDSEDPQTQAALDATLQNAATVVGFDFMSMGVDPNSVGDLLPQVVGFEKGYAKHIPSNSTWVKLDYGAMADAKRSYHVTFDDVVAAAPNLPMAEIIDKLGMSASPAYTLEGTWLQTLNELWTDDNLAAIKLVAIAKVLEETRAYRDQSVTTALLQQFGVQPQPADSIAYTACDNIHTFAHVLAKTYVDEVLGDNAKSRLEKLSQDLVDEYKEIVGNTPWIGDESKSRVIEKLDHMALNVLEPQGGFFDFEGLELTPSDQGGTLFSNYLKVKQYTQNLVSQMIGQPAVTSTPWFVITPMIENAFYDYRTNSISIMPGFMSSLVYRDDMDDAELLATSGWVVSHEISHGFDYMGAQMDAYGAPEPVFDDADVDKFVLKSSTLALYYNTIELMPGLHVDGQNVIGEAAADLCGMQANLELAKKIDGFDYEQYFKTASNLWAEVMLEAAFMQKLIDTHPMNYLRINVDAQMLDAIYDVFGVVEGDGMYLPPEERIVIWGEKA